MQTEYSELAPIAKMMNDMNADLNDKMAKMKEDQRLEKLILGSMEHGIVIFRSADDVILINKTAARLLDYEQNEPVRAFTEDREIADILAAREPSSVYRKLEGRDYNLRFTFKEQSSVLLITDVTESMAAARSKNDFIANVTHEMNTPLTSIRGFAELIAEGGVPPERIPGVAKTIIKQSDRLSNLIRSIINFSAIDSDELPDYEVDLTELVRETISSFEPKLSQKNISLKLDIANGVRVMSPRSPSPIRASASRKRTRIAFSTAFIRWINRITAGAAASAWGLRSSKSCASAPVGSSRWRANWAWARSLRSSFRKVARQFLAEQTAAKLCDQRGNPNGFLLAARRNKATEGRRCA